jgi:hypothetical protein
VVSGHGFLTAANGDHASFDGSVTASPLVGTEIYRDLGPANPMLVQSTSVEAVVCTVHGTRASIFGTATINGVGTFNLRIDVQDNGEPGSGSDRYRIRLSSGYDSGLQALAGGNIQIH